MTVQSPSFPVPKAFDLLCAQYVKRLPARLEDLTGPAHGTVDLPLHRVRSVLSLDDVIGTKVRAPADRGAVRDLIDAHAATRHRTTADLEDLGRRHTRLEFSLHDLRDRLAGAGWWDDQDFTDYGRSPGQVADLRAWALAWAADLDTRLYAGEDPDDN
ncbi:hypothetical protein GCM10010211_85500 [Streptomyces albospinus]|uniref:Uncharacterized protein n=1 Tax=Streptomyces albospinus TaxID=285515 RepID=A0ABQ2VPL3_9ACTN|nr:hypothetical protein GCM10010211_85500 [Streptomyces albospinus]